MEIEYDGTDYYGWQVQSSKVSKEPIKPMRTVQGELEKAIERLFRRSIRVVYAGRTDRGVHAKGQCVNFKVDTRIPLFNIKKALNTFLPDDILIKKVKIVPIDFHARYSASSKIYRYVILNSSRPDVFLRYYSWWVPDKLDVDKIRESTRYIVGERDFSCFARQPYKYKNPVRRVIDIVVRKRGRYMYIDIEATGFLRSMARNIVSLLVQVGTGEVSPSYVGKIVNKYVTYYNHPAPASGLYLWKVKYEKPT